MGVSKDLANYLTLTFDPAATNMMKFHEETDPAFITYVEGLATELDAKLAEKDMNVIQLMEEIAVK